jgi:hypothetical protein
MAGLRLIFDLLTNRYFLNPSIRSAIEPTSSQSIDNLDFNTNFELIFP